MTAAARRRATPSGDCSNAMAALFAVPSRPRCAPPRRRPEWSSPQLAKEMGRRLGKTLTAAGLRQTLHRAREKFADLLLEEVAHSLEAPTAERLAEELLDVGLLDYCRPALERRGHRERE